ncbi:MAG TPA: DUF3788 family protein [Anaerolineae bacterium]|nr:DUF3788 family protein [Anaerolineae bacterium]HQI86199.1 DUF3788 family protein [Anaerolineae bacterium]
MSIGAFTDKKHQPTEDEVFAMIGQKLPFWQELTQFIRETYPADEDFTFLYGKKYGWARRFRIRKQLLTSLYPAEGGFIVQINLSPEAVEQALAMQPGKNAREAIARAHPYPEGRWVFIPVGAADDVQDIKRLLALRVETKRLQGRSQ